MPYKVLSLVQNYLIPIAEIGITQSSENLDGLLFTTQLVPRSHFPDAPLYTLSRLCHGSPGKP